MPNEAARLASIKANRGVLVRSQSGDFWAIFDNGFTGMSVGDADVEAASPALTARSSDVEKLSKGTPLVVPDCAGRAVNYRVERMEPDGTGITRVVLRL